MLLLQQMVIMFILMIVGFVLKKRGIITPAGEKTLSGVVVNAANPAMVLSASINKESTIQGSELLRTFGLIVIVYIILIILAFILTRILRAPAGERGSYQNMTVFSNIGFMGFPLVSAMFGSEAMLYASLFVIPYNILIYTYAYVMMDKDTEAKCRAVGKDEEPGHGKAGSRPDTLTLIKKIFNIGVIASILTIIIYLTRIPMPKFVETTVNHLSNLTAPLSMIVIGASLTNIKIREMFTDKRLILFTAIKLLVIPVVGVFLIRLTGADELFVGVCLIMLGTPVGSMTAMLAGQRDCNYELAAKGVALTTLLSVITLPILSLIIL